MRFRNLPCPVLPGRIRLCLPWLLIALSALAPAMAADWRKLVPFAKHVEADARKDYELTDQHGPWLILCASFSGSEGEQQAQDLILELRKRYQVEAFKHRRTYDFTKPVVGLGVSRQGGPKIMRHRQHERFAEIGVLVGHYQSVDDPSLARSLQRIKHLRPESLDFNSRNGSSQRFVGLRDLYRRISPAEEKRTKGPMGNAFVTRNPLLPAGYFAPKGVDSLVVKMNKGVKFSLLKNPGRYTVKVATFRGNSSFKPSDAVQPIRRGSQPTKLELGAERAHRLTESLRARGVEAWEFHDRYESMVTVGSFDSQGEELPNGAIEINPAMLTVIRTYGPIKTPVGNGYQGIKPRSEAGIPFDVQPMPMEVPRASIAADYARNYR